VIPIGGIVKMHENSDLMTIVNGIYIALYDILYRYIIKYCESESDKTSIVSGWLVEIAGRGHG
jgi:hypothetical protein